MADGAAGGEMISVDEQQRRAVAGCGLPGGHRASASLQTGDQLCAAVALSAGLVRITQKPLPPARARTTTTNGGGHHHRQQVGGQAGKQANHGTAAHQSRSQCCVLLFYRTFFYPRIANCVRAYDFCVCVYVCMSMRVRV